MKFENSLHINKVSVVLPTFNERENIRRLITTILRVVPYPTEIIVIDDDSPDKTWEIAKKIETENKNVKLFRRINKRGLASAIFDGIFLSKGNIVVWMDCDFSMPPELIPKLINELNYYDIAVGSRYVKGGRDLRDSLIRVLASKIINLFASNVLNFSLRDYNSGFIAAKREIFNKVRFSTTGYGEYCIEFLYKAKKLGFKIKEVPYTLSPRLKGKTKTSPNHLTLLRHVLTYSFTIIKLRLIY